MRAVLDRRGMLLRYFEGATPATCLAWSPDGRQLVVGYRNGILRLWDVEQGQPVGQLEIGVGADRMHHNHPCAVTAPT